MNARIAKRNPINHTTTFYVPSEETPGKTYIVVRVVSDIAKKAPRTLWFCQCSDFFGRKLGHLFELSCLEQYLHEEHARRAELLAWMAEAFEEAFS